MALAFARIFFSIVICGVLSVSAFAETRPLADSVTNLWDKIKKEDFQTEQDFYIAVQKMAAQSDEAIALLSPELLAAKDDNQRVTITYVLGLATQYQKLKEERQVDLSPPVVAELKRVLHTTDEKMLQANIINIALMMEAKAEPFSDEMMDVLKKSDDPGLNATTTLAIGRIGDAVLPKIYDEIKQSDNARFVGDIARILRDSAVPPDVVAVLRQNALFGDTETRAQLLTVLMDLKGDKRELIPVVLNHLDKAETSRQRMMALYTLEKMSPPANVMIGALSDALEKLDPNGDAEERAQIVGLLLNVNDDGVKAVAAAIPRARTDREKSEIVQGLARRPTNDPVVIEALIGVATSREDRMLASSAIMGLTRIGNPALPAIEAAIETAKDADVKRDLQTAQSVIRSQP